MKKTVINLLNFVVWTFLAIILVWFGGIMEILKEGKFEILIALVISSFTLSLLVVEIDKRTRYSIMNLCIFFILGGIFMSTGFGIKYAYNSFIYLLLFIFITIGITFFISSCATLIMYISKISQIKSKKKENFLVNLNKV